MTPPYIRIVNWKKYQEDRRYKGSLLWVKLYAQMLNDPDLMMLPEVTQAHFLKLLLVAGRVDDRLPHGVLEFKPKTLAFTIRASRAINWFALVDAGLIEACKKADPKGFEAIPWNPRGLPAQDEDEDEDLLVPTETEDLSCPATARSEVFGISEILNGMAIPNELQLGEQLLARIFALSPHDSDSWRAWWGEAVTAARTHPDGLARLDEWTGYARTSAANGELDRPGHWLVGRLLAWARETKIKMPDMPTARAKRNGTARRAKARTAGARE